jgi:hypothetical protein
MLPPFGSGGSTTLSVTDGRRDQRGDGRYCHVGNRTQGKSSCADRFYKGPSGPLYPRWTPGAAFRQLPVRVKSAVLTVGLSLPVYRDKQTCSESVGMSQRCQNRTQAPAANIHRLPFRKRRRLKQDRPETGGSQSGWHALRPSTERIDGYSFVMCPRSHTKRTDA